MAKANEMTVRYPKPVWLKMSETDLKKVIIELSEKYQPAEIGLILRDQYGVPTTKVFGKKLNEYLKEAGKYEFQDLKNAEKKVERIKEHMKKNITDKKTKHMLQKAVSNRNALKKYSERKNK